VRRELGLKINRLLKDNLVKKIGSAIVLTPGVVKAGFLPIIMLAYPSSTVYVVGANGGQERVISGMKPEHYGFKTATVELVRDAVALKTAIAKRTKDLGVSSLEVSGVSTPDDAVLASTLRKQVSDFSSLTDARFQRLQFGLTSVLQGLVTEFQAALSRERSA